MGVCCASDKDDQAKPNSIVADTKNQRKNKQRGIQGSFQS